MSSLVAPAIKKRDLACAKVDCQVSDIYVDSIGQHEAEGTKLAGEENGMEAIFDASVSIIIIDLTKIRRRHLEIGRHIGFPAPH